MVIQTPIDMGGSKYLCVGGLTFCQWKQTLLEEDEF